MIATVLTLPSDKEGLEEIGMRAHATKKSYSLCLKTVKEPHKKLPMCVLELVALVFALKIWGHYPYGSKCEIYVDYKSLKYIFALKDLNMRQ